MNQIMPILLEWLIEQKEFFRAKGITFDLRDIGEVNQCFFVHTDGNPNGSHWAAFITMGDNRNLKDDNQHWARVSYKYTVHPSPGPVRHLNNPDFFAQLEEDILKIL